MTEMNLASRAVRRGPRGLFVEKTVVRPIQAFMNLEVSSGLLIILAAGIALAWANSPWQDEYFDFWHAHIVVDLVIINIDDTVGHLVNDGLMVLFFFVVGLEIKRELVDGELASFRRAALPAAAAIGGMVFPAGIFLAFNGLSGAGTDGWAIPVATDIAFALGILAILGPRVPFSVRVFLLALAIVDDLAGILIIALFYTSDLNVEALAWAAVIFAGILAVRGYGVRALAVYAVMGVILWAAIYESGIHATLTGVILAMFAPSKPLFPPEEFQLHARDIADRYEEAHAEGDHYAQAHLLEQVEVLSRESESPLERLEHMLHPWVSYTIVPIFALANAGIVVDGDAIEAASGSAVTGGIAAGLVIGKPLGIFLATLLAVRTGVANLPAGMTWRHVLGAGLLAGIGFTVALFITGLAYDDAVLVEEAKMGILGASVIAALLGLLFLWLAGSGAPAEAEAEGEAAAA